MVVKLIKVIAIEKNKDISQTGSVDDSCLSVSQHMKDPNKIL